MKGKGARDQIIYKKFEKERKGLKNLPVPWVQTDSWNIGFKEKTLNLISNIPFKNTSSPSEEHLQILIEISSGLLKNLLFCKPLQSLHIKSKTLIKYNFFSSCT